MSEDCRAATPDGWRVQADRTRLKQVLINLLSNGIKYNRPGGSLRCQARLEADTLRLEIIDSGMGLRPEQLARLFTPFERLDADARQVEGTGIGLALSKRLVDLMGGQIGASSEPGQGSCFWVSLPLSQDVPAPPPPSTALRPAASGFGIRRACTVLCIEDNVINLQLLEHALQDWAGMRMLAAPLPTIGLQLALDKQPDVILLDINLPIMDGYEVLAKLQANPATAHIPVIAVTANAMAGDRAHALAAGFAAYVTKPIDMPLLLEEIQQLNVARPYHPRSEPLPLI
jgi:CheY-like chemotaxis protein